MKRSKARARQLWTTGGLFVAALLSGVAISPQACAQAAAPVDAKPPADAQAQAGTAQAGPAGAAPQAATAATAPPPAEQPAGALQEIVVTATRHEEALSKVPESVSAFTEDQMDQRGIKDITDVVKFTPGVRVDATGTGVNQISIRGISSSGGSGTTGIYIDDTPIQIHSLGFNSDDTLPKIFDLERVEVLRGPQGTLFGAGSEGGTVRYILTQPSLNKSSVYARSEVAFTQGGAPSYEAGVAGGTPLVDGTLGVRASFWYRRDGGWIDRIDPFTLATVQNNANYDNTWVGRVAAKWAVTPEVTLTPSVLYQDRYRNDISVFWMYDRGANGQVATSDPANHRFLNADPTQRTEPDRYWLPALKAEADVFDGSASLISNTSYYARHDESGYDGTLYNLGYYQTLGTRLDPSGNPVTGANQFDPTLQFANNSYYPLVDQYGLHLPAGIQNYRAPATVVNQQNTFTEEIRLQSADPNARLTWTTGIFYQFSRERSVEEIYDPMVDQLFQNLFVECSTDANGNPLIPCPPLVPNANPPGTPATATGSFGLGLFNGYSYYNYNTGHDRQIATFGELNFKLTDQWTLTAGARIAKTAFNFTHFATGTQNGTTTTNSGNKEETPFTPKVGVSYQADPNDLYYFTYAKGFRTGGDNAPIPQLLCPATFAELGLTSPTSPATYNSDTVRSYEFGSKNFLAGSLKLASSFYYINWDNIQQNVYLPGCGFQFTTNVGHAYSKGFDIQADWAATQALSFETAIGYTSARYGQDASLVPGGAPIARTGDSVVGDSGTAPPPWTLAIGALYNFTAFDLKSYFRIDYEYEAKSHTPTAAQDPRVSFTVYDPYAYTPSSTNFVTVRAGTVVHRWNVSAFIDNLLDAHPLLPPGGPNSHTDADPTAPPGQGVLIRNYTFRPRTFGLTAVYRM